MENIGKGPNFMEWYKLNEYLKQLLTKTLYERNNRKNVEEEDLYFS